MNYNLLISILVFMAVLSLGGAALLARAFRRHQLQLRLAEGYGGHATSDSGSALFALLRSIGMAFGPGDLSNRYRQKLARAGIHNSMAPNILIGLKLLLLAVGLVVAAIVLLPMDMGFVAKLWLASAIIVPVTFLPDLYLYQRHLQRSTEIRHHLPDALDLLEISVSAGTGLDLAWVAVGDEIRRVSPTLADEMALANLEIHLGAPRPTAMRHMAARVASAEIASLVAVLIQTDRFGTSIADALRTFAASMREQRSQRAEEAAEKLAVKLLFPMVIFIFPAIVIMAAGPAGIRIVEVLLKN